VTHGNFQAQKPKISVFAVLHDLSKSDEKLEDGVRHLSIPSICVTIDQKQLRYLTRQKNYGTQESALN